MLCSRRVARAMARAVVDPLAKVVSREMDREAIRRSRRTSSYGVDSLGARDTCEEFKQILAANNGKKPEGYMGRSREGEDGLAGDQEERTQRAQGSATSEVHDRE